MCRAGFKLEKALDHFGIDVSGATALDSGLSTGGFTHCLLQRGARHVSMVHSTCGTGCMGATCHARSRSVGQQLSGRHTPCQECPAAAVLARRGLDLSSSWGALSSLAPHPDSVSLMAPLHTRWQQRETLSRAVCSAGRLGPSSVTASAGALSAAVPAGVWGGRGPRSGDGQHRAGPARHSDGAHQPAPPQARAAARAGVAHGVGRAGGAACSSGSWSTQQTREAATCLAVLCSCTCTRCAACRTSGCKQCVVLLLVSFAACRCH